MDFIVYIYTSASVYNFIKSVSKVVSIFNVCYNFTASSGILSFKIIWRIKFALK